ncbi:MAG: hypothetical protein Ta2D_02060 [Rickettsiales bacterium]|nr:MAG: hypothetical protein Ta2D_02060 [Rickettsiales bacterium]
MTDENKTRVFAWNEDITDRELLIFSILLIDKWDEEGTTKVDTDIAIKQVLDKDGKLKSVITHDGYGAPLYDTNGKINNIAFKLLKSLISENLDYNITENDFKTFFISNIPNKTDEEYFEHKIKAIENHFKENYINLNDSSKPDIIMKKARAFLLDTANRQKYNLLKRGVNQLENEKIKGIDDVKELDDAAGINGDKGTFTMHKTNGKDKKMFAKYNHIHDENTSFDNDLLINKLFNGKKTRGIAVPKFVNNEKETGKIAFSISREYDTDLLNLIYNIANGFIFLSENEENKIVADLIYGVHQLSKKNIAEGDLKPENIFIDGDKNAYIGDWGLLRENADKAQKLYCNEAHLAPEAYANDKIAVPKENEIWSIGAVFYDLFTKDYDAWIDLCKAIDTSANFITCQIQINDIIDNDYRILYKQKDFLKKVLIADPRQRPDIEMVAKLAKDILGIDSIPLKEDDFVPIKKPAIAPIIPAPIQKKEPDRRSRTQIETPKKIQENKRAETSPILKPKQVERERF